MAPKGYIDIRLSRACPPLSPLFAPFVLAITHKSLTDLSPTATPARRV